MFKFVLPACNPTLHSPHQLQGQVRSFTDQQEYIHGRQTDRQADRQMEEEGVCEKHLLPVKRMLTSQDHCLFPLHLTSPCKTQNKTSLRPQFSYTNFLSRQTKNWQSLIYKGFILWLYVNIIKYYFLTSVFFLCGLLLE